jgi:phosphonopyruvate decarboxylase
MAKLNAAIAAMAVYASKAISQMAKASSDVLDLSIGEPEFGPPKHILASIVQHDLTIGNFLDSVKRYEQSCGSAELRRAISLWYAQRYGLKVDPDEEILITHGAVEAIALAILSTTQDRDRVVITDPSYMLYERSVTTLGRVPVAVPRPTASEEYRALIEEQSALSHGLSGAAAMIVNSPENPTGYVIAKGEWDLLGEIAAAHDVWIIHDEVYDTMAFDRPHYPARVIRDLVPRTVLVNSFSKKFGTPGLRIGWLVASPDVIKLASKAHDYLCLGVNILYERVATRLLSDPDLTLWLAAITAMLQSRAAAAVRSLPAEAGYKWDHVPRGGMFLFPNVEQLYSAIPSEFKPYGCSIGDAVAKFLVQRQRVATVPGSVYGLSCRNSIRLVTCAPEAVFDAAIKRLAGVLEPVIT